MAEGEWAHLELEAEEDEVLISIGGYVHSNAQSQIKVPSTTHYNQLIKPFPWKCLGTVFKFKAEHPSPLLFSAHGTQKKVIPPVPRDGLWSTVVVKQEINFRSLPGKECLALKSESRETAC